MALLRIPGQVTVELSGDLQVIPDGDMIDCTLSISLEATSGSAALRFDSADLSDGRFADFSPTGTDANV